MEFIIDNIQNNRVTLDIKSNKFEESYEYTPISYDKFNEIENLIDLYKSVNKKQVFDKFIYSILLYLDNTLSLIGDKELFINKFKIDLKNKLPNYMNKLSKLGISEGDINNAINNQCNREPLYHYLSHLFEKSIAIQEVENINIYGSHDTVLLYEDNIKELDMNNCLNIKYELRKNHHLKNEKLNDLLVKDLKVIAEDLGLETTKLENGKKKNLLKAELKDVIKVKLYS
jgi:hypothetical protein